MKQEEKDLLLKDLCARLPYGVKVYGNYSYSDGEKIVDDKRVEVLDISTLDWFLNGIEIKPYLFPMSSMTEEQKKEYESLCIKVTPEYTNFYDLIFPKEYYDTVKSIDYLYKNHIDVRGLIPKGLANDATGLNIY